MRDGPAYLNNAYYRWIYVVARLARIIPGIHFQLRTLIIILPTLS